MVCMPSSTLGPELPIQPESQCAQCIDWLISLVVCQFVTANIYPTLLLARGFGLRERACYRLVRSVMVKITIGRLAGQAGRLAQGIMILQETSVSGYYIMAGGLEI